MFLKKKGCIFLKNELSYTTSYLYSLFHRGDILIHPTFFAGVAQLVEHLICNQVVTGSTPVTGFLLKYPSYTSITYKLKLSLA